MNTILTLLFTLLTIPSSFRMMVVSDPHVLDSTLYDINSQSMQSLMTNKLNQYEYAQPAFIQIIDKAIIEQPDVVLIPGDLTMDGSRVDHQSVAYQLHRLTDANIKVCVIPGNHDINNGNAASYLGSTKQSVASISSEEFDSIYAFLNEAFPNRREDPNSHSYVQTIAPRLTLLGIDATAGYYSDKAGSISTATKNWILAQADSAVVKGDRVIAMLHYQLIVPIDDMDTIAPQAFVRGHDDLVPLFRQHGVEMILTGHMHTNNNSVAYINYAKDSLVEVSTGSPSMYPNPYRTITMSDSLRQFDVTTQYITSLPGNATFSPANNKQHVVDNVNYVQLPKYVEWAWANKDSLYGMVDDVTIPEDYEWIVNLIGGKKIIKNKITTIFNNLPQTAEGRANYVRGFVGTDVSDAAILIFEGNENQKNTDALKAALIKDAENIAADMIDKAGFTLKTTRNKLKDAANDFIEGDQVGDVIDGIRGDYTNYQSWDQNQMNDLNPTLRFKSLIHRDYYATVSFDMQGHGEAIDPVKVLINTPTALQRPTNPTDPYYAFVDWYTEPEYTNVYDFNQLLDSTEDFAFTLYAKWKPIIRLAVSDTTKMYDGTSLNPQYYIASGSMPKSDVLTVEYDTIITNADTVTFHIASVKVMRSGEDVTDKYAFEWKPDGATAAITRRSIDITTASDTMVYNGTPLVCKKMTMKGDGFVGEEGINTYYTGSQTMVGTSKNTMTYVAKEGTLLGNYNIIVVEGDLTVTAREIALALRDTAKIYDGTSLTAQYTLIGTLAEGDEIAVELTNGTLMNADTLTASIQSVTITNGTNDVTDQYSITYTKETATLSIAARELTITSASDSKTYDGTPLMNSATTQTGDSFVEGEGIDIVMSGSQTTVGSSDNTFTYTAKEGTNLNNYIITTVYGTLTVNAREISLELQDANKIYDGTSLTAQYTLIGTFAEGDEISVDLTNGTLMNADTLTASIQSVTITNGTNDVTDQYDIRYTKETAMLSIAARAITIISASDSMEYDTSTLTNDSVTIEGTFVQGEGIDIYFTGSQTEVGSSSNTFTIDAKTGTLLSNYNFTFIYGTLIVTDPSTPTAIDNGMIDEQVDKMIINGQLFIRRRGKLYTATGQEL